MNIITQLFRNSGAMAAALGVFALPIASAPSASAQAIHNYITGCYDDPSGIAPSVCPRPSVTTAPRFVAIAISNTTLATGSAWGYPSRQAAEQRALRECRKSAKDCEIADWAYDQCLALAVSPDGSWGVDRAAYADSARARALQQCNSVSSKCVVKLHPCSGD